MARRRQQATLDDVVEVLEGIGAILMTISAKLDDIIDLLGADEDEETDA